MTTFLLTSSSFMDRPMPDMLWELHHHLPMSSPRLLRRAPRAVAAAAAEAAAAAAALQVQGGRVNAAPARELRGVGAMRSRGTKRGPAVAAAAMTTATAAVRGGHPGKGERAGTLKGLQGGGRGLGSFWGGTGREGAKDALLAADGQGAAAAAMAPEVHDLVGEPWRGYRGNLGNAVLRTQRGRGLRMGNGVYVSLNNRLQKFNKRRRDAVGVHEAYFRQAMGGQPLPGAMAHFGMAQFLVSRQRVRKHTRALWLNALNFTLFYGARSSNGACQDSVHNKKGRLELEAAAAYREEVRVGLSALQTDFGQAQDEQVPSGGASADSAPAGVPPKRDFGIGHCVLAFALLLLAQSATTKTHA
ncbi:hypothetical protein DUNSADRAFT_9159 [Dunaliella salina]|uniref:Encoded protein n=1 Tax=Dunaliella salina TaxID=3046 RepID=A0ABQ7GI18_DUNSA|nr:hypothetical protein DUNSADRAFT_9159 [Dunaliella salina]|eukprot:KAF5834246.1 hypothetical protein DUNSADRAFT_9159 [Dunaliella salina]